MTGKTNKSFSKRLKVTKKGKVLARKSGQNHFRAKEMRKKQLSTKRLQSFNITKKNLGKYLPLD
jgi:ribosomal protein L35